MGEQIMNRQHSTDDHIPFGTFHGGDTVPAGTFHGGDTVPAGTFHAGA